MFKGGVSRFTSFLVSTFSYLTFSHLITHSKILISNENVHDGSKILTNKLVYVTLTQFYHRMIFYNVGPKFSFDYDLRVL